MGGNERLIPCCRGYFQGRKDKHVNLTSCGEHGSGPFVSLGVVFLETRL
jgi:hypothetical protein